MEPQDKSNKQLNEESAQTNSDSSADPILGSTIENRFQLLTLLGKGAAGKVYKAQHLMLDQLVAVKILYSRHLDSDKSQQRFRNEAALLSNLQHENVVRFLAYGITNDGKPYLVTEFLDGITLADLLRTEGSLEAEFALPIFLDLCKGLGAAHNKGVVHRDIKPSNIMIMRNQGVDTAKILDFGVFRSEESKDLKLTETGSVIGSCNYMSPEQCINSRDIDSRADIYSLGCVMYECLAGNPPMQSDSDLLTMQYQMQKIIEKVPAPRGISAALESVILKCLEKKPEQRFANVDDLQLALSNTEKSKTKQTIGTKSKKPVIISITLCATILIMAAAVSFNQHTTSNAPAKNEILKKNHDAPIPDFDLDSNRLKDVKRAEDWLENNVNNPKYAANDLGALYVQLKIKHATQSIPFASNDLYKNVYSRIKGQSAGKKLSESNRAENLFALARVAAARASYSDAEAIFKDIDNLTVNPESWIVEYHKTLRDCAQTAGDCGDIELQVFANQKALKLCVDRGDVQQTLLDRMALLQALVDHGDINDARKTAHEAMTDASIDRDDPDGHIAIPVLLLLDPMQRVSDPRVFERFMVRSLYYEDEKLIEKNPRFFAEHYKSGPARETFILRLRIVLVKSIRYANRKKQARTILSNELQKRMLKIMAVAKEEKVAFSSQAEIEFIEELMELDEEGELIRDFLAKVKDLGQECYLRVVLELADQAIRENRYRNEHQHVAEIVKLLGQASKISEASPDTLLKIKIRLAKMLWRKQEYEKVIQKCRTIISELKNSRSDDRLLQTYNLLLHAALDLKKFDIAEQVVAAVDLNGIPSTASSGTVFTYKFLKASLFLETGKVNEAHTIQQKLWGTYHNQSLTVISSFAKLTESLYKEALAQGNPKEAQEYLRKGIKQLCNFRRSDTTPLLRLMALLDQASKIDSDKSRAQVQQDWLAKTKPKVLFWQHYYGSNAD